MGQHEGQEAGSKVGTMSVKTCEHELTVENEDPWGNTYVVCEDCEEEVTEEVDAHVYYSRDERGRVMW